MAVPTGVPKQHAAVSTIRDMTFTKAPLYKRADVCPQNYSLCPSSLSGGCCPSDHSCGTSSCYATTPAPLSVCTESGYYECRLVDGGGCCPEGYACASSSCIPTTSAAISITCSASFYLCPLDLGGCCHSGYACGKGYCYQTTFPTVQVTILTTKTDSKGHVATVNTVIKTAYTPSTQPTLSPSPVATAAVSRFTPTITPIAKVASTPGSSSGLSKGALAGIIVGVVIILIAIIATGWCVLRRINAVAKQSEGHRTSGSGSGSNRPPMAKNRNGGLSGDPSSGPTNVDFDNMSIDPLMMTSSGTATPRLSRPTPTHNSSYDTQNIQSPAISPPIPTPYASPIGNTQGYEAVPLGDAQYFDTRHHSSQVSPSNVVSPYSPGYPTSTSWGEPVLDPALRDQNLRFGRIGSPQSAAGNRHWSQISDVSALSSGSGPGAVMAELDPRNGLTEMADSDVATAAAGAEAPNRSSVGSHKKTKSFEFIAHRRKRSSTGSGVSQLLTPPLHGGQSPILENEGETEEVASGAEWERRHRATRSEETGEGGQIVYAHQAERNSLPTPIVARGRGVGDEALPSPRGVNRKPLGGGGVAGT